MDQTTKVLLKMFPPSQPGNRKVLQEIFPPAPAGNFCMANIEESYVCTRQKGHKGVHVAHVGGNEIVAIEGEEYIIQ